MIKKIISKFESILTKKVLNYNTSDFWYIKFLNFKTRKYGYKFSISDLPDKEPKYKIVDIITNKTIFFGYRQQGLMCYSGGIAKRGISLANQYMIDSLSFNDGDYIFDIGANTGDFKIYFDNNNIKINYYGFDPGLIEYNSLKRNISNGLYYNLALGNTNTVSSFYYKPEFGDSSLVEMSDYLFKYDVKVNTFETFIIENNLQNRKIKLLKVEAEGFEPEIIYGIGDFLNNIEYITADLGFERGINQETTAPQVLEYLILNGFEIIKINKDRFCFLLKNKNYKI